MGKIYAVVGIGSAPFPEDMRGVSHHLLGNRMRNRGDVKVVLIRLGRGN